MMKRREVDSMIHLLHKLFGESMKSLVGGMGLGQSRTRSSILCRLERWAGTLSRRQ